MEKKNENTETNTSLSCRQILKIGALAGAGLIFSGKLKGSKARAQEPDFCPDMPPNLNLEPFVDFGSPQPGYPDPPPNYPYPTLLLNNRRFSDPPTETPAAGSTEIWNFINLAPDTHPIHLHQTQFRILSRQDFDVAEYLDRYGVDGPVEDPDIPFTDDPMPPYPFEDGRKDTVRANPGQVTRIEVPFGAFRERFVWHCHILDHEDNEMMQTMMIV